ncbi:MAG TPA: YdcF family protein [Bacillota bacterium]|nr:YdcF family protein [Bacillota bacterium]
MQIKSKSRLIATLLCFPFVVLLVIAACPPWPLLAAFLAAGDRPEKADVIITLGGDSERELYAADLYLAGLAPGIIMSGCGASAWQMAKRAAGRGVVEKDILIEDKSENTYQNAVYTREIVLAHNFRSAIVVTSPYHMRRTRLVFGRVFRKTGVKLIYCSARDSGFNADGRCRGVTDRQIVRREYVKLVYYWFRYW